LNETLICDFINTFNRSCSGKSKSCNTEAGYFLYVAISERLQLKKPKGLQVVRSKVPNLNKELQIFYNGSHLSDHTKTLAKF